MEHRPELILEAIDSLLDDAAEREEWDRVDQLVALKAKVEDEVRPADARAPHTRA